MITYRFFSTSVTLGPSNTERSCNHCSHEATSEKLLVYVADPHQFTPVSAQRADIGGHWGYTFYFNHFLDNIDPEVTLRTVWPLRPSLRYT